MRKDGARVWVAPLVNWSASDKEAYINANQLERNEVVAKLCMSGECLCGAFARKGEIQEIELWYPEVAARIRELEAKARAAGVPAVWGTPPPRRPKTSNARSAQLGLCWSCEAKKEAAQTEE